MRKEIVTLLLSGVLASCASAYDQEKVPAALGMLKIENQDCITKVKTDAFKTAAEFAGCLADSRQHFAANIDLTHPELVQVYRLRVTQLGTELDAGRLSADQAVAGLRDAEKDFYDGIEQVGQIDAQRRQQTAAAFAAAGQSLQNAAAYQRANRPPAPVITTTTCNAWSRTSGQCTSVTN